MSMTSSQQGEHLDRASLLERVEGDHELLAEMIHLFLEDAPRLLAAMHDALAAAEHDRAGAFGPFHEGRREQSLGARTVAAAVDWKKAPEAVTWNPRRLCLATLEGSR